MLLDRKKRKSVPKDNSIWFYCYLGAYHLHGEYAFSENKLKDSVWFNMSQILALKVTGNWNMERQIISLN
jgi:hypothetical protein